MASKDIIEVSNDVLETSTKFLHDVESNVYFDSRLASDLFDTEWLERLEYACPYIDIIVRNPKLALIKEENVVLVEKAKKIDVTSVKDLAKHTERISRYDRGTDSVEPKKILDIRNEETFNIYENRFLYTVVKMTIAFVSNKERMLKKLDLKDYKLLEYSSKTTTLSEKVNIQVKVNSESIPKGKMDKDVLDKVKEIKKRIKRIKDFLLSWERSPMMKEIEAAHISLMKPPIRKTNVILKNPNFQVAVKLWEYLYKFSENKEESGDNTSARAGNVLLGFLDHSFLVDYFVMNSMAVSKREQKKKMATYAVLLLSEEIRRIMALLKNMGLDITDEELMRLVAKELHGNNERLVGVSDVKKKFKSAMSEYLERTQDVL